MLTIQRSSFFSPKIISNYFFSIFILFANPVYAATTINPQQLTIGIDLTYAPYAYLDKGQASGFDPDFMRLIAEKMGKQAIFKDTRIENIIIGLNAKHYDVVASALYVNPQRAKQVDFLPYLQTGGVLVVRGDDSFRPQTLEELCGKRISSMKGASWISRLNAISNTYCLPKGFGAIEVKEFPSAPEAAQALLSKGVDVQYEDAAVAKMVIDALGGRLAISTKQMLDPVLIGLAFDKNNTALKQQITELFAEVRASGEYAKLLQKYNLAYPQPELLESNAASLSSAANVGISGFNWAYLAGLFIKKEFWQATVTVIKLSTFTWVLAVIFGFFLALAHRSQNQMLQKIAKAYIWFFRSLPLLVLLIFIYNLPQAWPSSALLLSSPFIAGLIALTLSESAYIAEIHRGALQAVPKGQIEAGKALGISFFGIQRLIIIPQALRVALPTLANQFVTIVKLTSLVSVISLTEILLVGQQLYTRNFLVIETLIAVAFYYVLIVSLITYLLKKWEQHLDVSKQLKPKFIAQAPLQALNKSSAISTRKNSGYALQIKHAHKKFGETAVLKNINLDIKWGEVTCIIGPSGSGKTTLIRSINGLEVLDQGEIYLQGERFLAGKNEAHPISHHDVLNKIVHIGMVFQSFNLFPHKTVQENVMLAPLYHHSSNKVEIQARALAILDKVGLLALANQYPHQLSGGQQQRVAIARALIMQPAIILFDEPTSALDPELVNDVLLVIEELAKEGMTMLIVTHEMKFAFRVSDRIIFMENGSIVHDAAPEQLQQSHDSRLARFLDPVNH
ncbi:ABC transporter permease subunit [Neisseriaceae bacterium TC5R-5]|nr:ABC transporter permease subunit [Neisseriaceae bacterium TC5R-5]